MEMEMPHTHRSFSDRGIADTIWKRARWARQARFEEFWGREPKAIRSKTKSLPKIASYVTAAVVNFLKGNEDAERSRRPSDSKNNPQRRFNRQR